jgi:hypothetical protein
MGKKNLNKWFSFACFSCYGCVEYILCMYILKSFTIFLFRVAYAQKPRDIIQNSRKESAVPSPTYQAGQSPGEIWDKINRIRITLANKVRLVNYVPL